MKQIERVAAFFGVVGLATALGCGSSQPVNTAPQQVAPTADAPGDSPVEQAVAAQRAKEAEAAQQPVPLGGP